jgi:hypothetical protein
LLGTRALPGCEPWELGLAFSLKPLIESRPIVFDGLPAQLRLRMLALLGANPCTLSGEFWERLYHRRPEYQSPAWRGMLRVDWDRACAHLADFPHDDSALRSLRHHARFALQRIQKDETGHLRIGFSRAIRTAHPAVRTVIEEEARKMGVSLAQSGLGLNRPLVDWVCYWLDLEPDPDEAAPVRDANGTTVDDQCLANLVGILEKVEEFDKPVATKINDGVAIDFSIKEAFGVAENSLRYHYGEGTRELELLEMARARPLQDGETIARARALQESEMAESEPSI